MVARASLPTPYMCYCCGKHTGTDVQTPCDVFAVGYRLGGHELAMRCLKEMWELLEAENFTEVTRRTACCKMVSCMLAQNRLAAIWLPCPDMHANSPLYATVSSPTLYPRQFLRQLS